MPPIPPILVPRSGDTNIGAVQAIASRSRGRRTRHSRRDGRRGRKPIGEHVQERGGAGAETPMRPEALGPGFGFALPAISREELKELFGRGKHRSRVTFPESGRSMNLSYSKIIE